MASSLFKYEVARDTLILGHPRLIHSYMHHISPVFSPIKLNKKWVSLQFIYTPVRAFLAAVCRKKLMFYTYMEGNVDGTGAITA